MHEHIEKEFVLFAQNIKLLKGIMSFKKNACMKYKNKITFLNPLLLQEELQK